MSYFQITYPDVISVFIIPIIISIFAFALPMLLQVASRIDDKYSSTLLVKVFFKDYIFRSFIGSLFLCFFSCIMWIWQPPRCVEVGRFNDFVDNSALILLVVSGIILIITTISVIYLTTVFYRPDKLLERLINQFESKYSKNKESYPFHFKTVSPLLYYSINKADESLARELLQFLFDTFAKHREGKENKIVNYPEEFYNVIFEANELLCMRERRTISLYNDSSLYWLFLDEYQHTIISDNTFKFLWRSICQSIFYNKDEFVISYWEKAHQYCNFYLQTICPKYDDDFNIINQEEIDQRYKERERFIEFHYALGGLLLYKKKYNLIREITLWTNQTPPKYVLVPETMEEVIARYMSVHKKDFYLNPVYYQQHFPFPDIKGVYSEDIIQMWIQRYISVLFLRQYTLEGFYTYSDTLQIPVSPESLIEKQKWNEELDGLQSHLIEYLSNHEILGLLGLEELVDEDWFKNNNKETPQNIISKLRAGIIVSAELARQNQTIDPEKEKQFEQLSKDIINRTLSEYSEIFVGSVKKNYKSRFFGGLFQLMDKGIWVKESEISSANADSIVAETISLALRRNMLDIFRLMESEKYILKEEDIFKAIDYLKLNKDKFILVSIGLNLEYFKRYSNLVNTDGKWTYSEIPIIEINCSTNTELYQTLVVLKKNNLPTLIRNNVSEGQVLKYKLKNIDDSNIYTNIIDFKERTDIIEEVQQKTKTEDLSKSVLVCVDLNLEIRYKNNANCKRFKIYSQFEDRGTPNKISDIKKSFTVRRTPLTTE